MRAHGGPLIRATPVHSPLVEDEPGNANPPPAIFDYDTEREFRSYSWLRLLLRSSDRR